ncbi:serine/threonine-protein kinase [Pengzhenrongella sicca]|uniref:Serine/threonine protein kinase n=1 Tax=Pengzhenrongella sicca TaxID=2819238 RepID=A0A8A4ZFV7_9MICO|nr:serine/threonine-protein kinase [Pengzhenrongella sicca]QTE29823.1 serine/threonine protein kinase [Pengzhenrongella sicca]
MERIGLTPGSEVGGYRIIAPLGEGGMGAVYRAVDGGGTEVAIKLLHPHIGADPVARDRLRREVAALQRLRHPAVAAVLDAEADSTEAFVVTELIDGLNLDEHVRAHGPLSGPELARLAAGLREALEAVHRAGVVHRDLKPSNVLVTDDGPVLIDFGIAQAVGDPRLTSTNLIVGTPGYLAPELLADNEPSAVSDWWGWAAVLAFAATGREPFGTRPLDAVFARTRAGDVDVVGLGPLTGGALRAALDPDPTLRALPDDVQADLDEAAVDGDPVAPAPRTMTILPTAPATAYLPASLPPTPDPTAYLSPSPDPSQSPPTAVLPAFDGSANPAGLPQDQSGAEPEYEPATPGARVGSLLALGIVAAAGAALYPGVAAVGALVAVVLFRTVGSAAQALQARRVRRGGVGRADTARAVAASPWHLLRALVGLVPSLLVGASLAVLVGGVLWWALDTERLVISPRGVGGGTAAGGGNEPWVYSAVLAVAFGLGLLAVWFGPTSRLTRLGARSAVAGLAPGNAGAVVVTLLALGGAVLLVTLVVTGHDVTWWPLADSPAQP